MPHWLGKVCVFCVETFKKNNSIIATIWVYRREFKLAQHDSVPRRKTILKWVTDFQSGDKHRRNRGGQPCSTRTNANIEKLKQMEEASPTRSVRKRTQITGIPRTSLWRILREDLHLHLFKIQITQQLQPGDPVKCKMFCERMLNLLRVRQ